MAIRRDTKGPSQRQLRVGEELRHVLADILRRGDFRDPDLQNLNVTVTEVRISPDLKNATAYVMPLGGEGVETAIRALNRAAPFFRSQVARVVKLQHMPRISFEIDTSLDYAQHINTLLHRPEVARDLAGDKDAAGDDDNGA